MGYYAGLGYYGVSGGVVGVLWPYHKQTYAHGDYKQTYCMPIAFTSDLRSFPDPTPFSLSHTLPVNLHHPFTIKAKAKKKNSNNKKVAMVFLRSQLKSCDSRYT